MEVATFAAGCFWCYEPIFDSIRGIESVRVGYSGGHVPDPMDREVYSGTTGQAEAFQITFDPNIISYDQLLDVFWYVHDPTSLNKQGYDVGEIYRSVIFYHNEDQKDAAEKSKSDLDSSGLYDKPIVTIIESFKNFYEAEDYHRNYYKNHPHAGYCRVIIKPKVEKFEEKFKHLLK